MYRSEANQEILAAAEMCPHGNSREAFCEYCLKDSRETQLPVWQDIGEILKRSKYARSALDSPECVIEREGRKYSIELIENENDPELLEVQALLEQVFGKEEVDPVEVLNNAVSGRTPVGTKDETRYRIFVVKDAGRVVSLYTGGVLEMRGQNEKPTGEAMLMGAYGVTDPSQRRKGLTRELYVSMLMQAAADAHKKGLKLLLQFGEATSTSEAVWNHCRKKRVYAKSKENEKELIEVPYIQPPLDYDTDTGEVAEGAGAAPEHAMVELFGAVDKEQLQRAVEASYRWNNENILPREAFSSDEAFSRQRQDIQRHKDALREFLSAHGDLVFLAKEERENLKVSGSIIHEHTDADKDRKTGLEDF